MLVLGESIKALSFFDTHILKGSFNINLQVGLVLQIQSLKGLAERYLVIWYGNK